MRSNIDSLSDRQKRVADLTCRGYANKQVAIALGCGIRTVEQETRAIRRAFRAESMAQATYLIGRLGGVYAEVSPDSQEAPRAGAE